MSLTKATYSMISGAPVNVRDFGAVGNGVTDDTAAIQAALDVGGNVYFPGGTYKVTGALTAESTVASPKALVMIGTGGDSTIAFSSGGSLSLTKRFTNTVFACRDLVFTSDGNSATKILFNAASGEITNCIFVGFDEALVVNQAYQLIQHNFFRNCTTGIRCLNRATDPVIAPGIYYNANAINNNNFYECDIGILLADGNVAGGAGPFYINPNTLTQNTFESCYVAGIKLEFVKCITIDANYFELTPINIHAIGKCRNVTISNILSHSGEVSIKLDDSSATLAGGVCKNFELSNNSVLIESAPRNGTLEGVTLDATSRYIPWDASWAAPTLLNSWTDTGAPYQAARYAIQSPGIVQVQGVVTGGSLNTDIFVLPFGFRPESALTFTSANILSGSVAVIRVESDGSVYHLFGSTTNISLNFSFTAVV
jgi:hypothetical protein